MFISRILMNFYRQGKECFRHEFQELRVHMSRDIPLNSSFFISRSFFRKSQYFIDNSHIIITDSHIGHEKNESYTYTFDESSQ